MKPFTKFIITIFCLFLIVYLIWGFSVPNFNDFSTVYIFENDKPKPIKDINNVDFNNFHNKHIAIGDSFLPYKTSIFPWNKKRIITDSLWLINSQIIRVDNLDSIINNANKILAKLQFGRQLKRKLKHESWGFNTINLEITKCKSAASNKIVSRNIWLDEKTLDAIILLHEYFHTIKPFGNEHVLDSFKACGEIAKHLMSPNQSYRKEFVYLKELIKYSQTFSSTFSIPDIVWPLDANINGCNDELKISKFDYFTAIFSILHDPINQMIKEYKVSKNKIKLIPQGNLFFSNFFKSDSKFDLDSVDQFLELYYSYDINKPTKQFVNNILNEEDFISEMWKEANSFGLPHKKIHIDSRLKSVKYLLKRNIEKFANGIGYKKRYVENLNYLKFQELEPLLKISEDKVIEYYNSNIKNNTGLKDTFTKILSKSLDSIIDFNILSKAIIQHNKLNKNKVDSFRFLASFKNKIETIKKQLAIKEFVIILNPKFRNLKLKIDNKSSKFEAFKIDTIRYQSEKALTSIRYMFENCDLYYSIPIKSPAYYRNQVIYELRESIPVIINPKYYLYVNDNYLNEYTININDKILKRNDFQQNKYKLPKEQKNINIEYKLRANSSTYKTMSEKIKFIHENCKDSIKIFKPN